MKKTLLLLTLGLGTICLTSCSRGYGCPYSTEAKIQKPEQRDIQKSDAILITKELETYDAEVISD